MGQINQTQAPNLCVSFLVCTMHLIVKKAEACDDSSAPVFPATRRSILPLSASCIITLMPQLTPFY